VALFFAVSGTAVALPGSNTVFSDDIVNEEVTSPDIKNGSVGAIDIRAESVGSNKVADDSLGAIDLAPDSVGSSEIVSNVVGADELDLIHEHFSGVTDITDTTAHDGAYGFAQTTVSCGFGEDLLSVSIDWIDDNLHNETVFGGVDDISRFTNPQTATARVGFDGGGGAADPAQFQVVATGIF
jgi:hypothetical protein